MFDLIKAARAIQEIQRKGVIKSEIQISEREWVDKKINLTKKKVM